MHDGVACTISDSPKIRRRLGRSYVPVSEIPSRQHLRSARRRQLFIPRDRHSPQHVWKPCFCVFFCRWTNMMICVDPIQLLSQYFQQDLKPLFFQTLRNVSLVCALYKS